MQEPIRKTDNVFGLLSVIFNLRKVLIALIAFALVACGSDTEQSQQNKQGNLNQALIGPLAGAEIRAFLLKSPDKPIEGTIVANESLTDLDAAGTFTLNLAGIKDNEWVLVTATGGVDIDADHDGLVDDRPTPNNGTLHAIAKAKDWRSGGKNINLLTEIAYQSVYDLIRTNKYDALQANLDWIASGLLSTSLVGDNVPSYLDLLYFNPSNSNNKQALIVSEGLITALNDAIYNNDANLFNEIIATNLKNKVSLLPQLNTIRVEPVVSVPDNRQNIASSDVKIRSAISETSDVFESGNTLLIAESDGRTVLLGYSFQETNSNSRIRSASGNASLPTGISIESTALAMIMMMAGNQLDQDDQGAQARSIINHRNFKSTTDKMEEIFKIDPFFLDNLKLYETLVTSLKSIAADVHNDLVKTHEQSTSKNQVKSTSTHNQSLAFPILNAELNKTFSWLDRLSSWYSDQPWNWYGSTTRFNVTDKPFLAVQSNKRNNVALANPGMLYHSMTLFDSNGERLRNNPWLILPKNSSMVDKARNTGAAQRELDGSSLPTTTAYVEIEQFLWSYSSDHAATISGLNKLDAAMMGIGLVSPSLSKTGRDSLVRASRNALRLQTIITTGVCGSFLDSVNQPSAVAANDNSDAYSFFLTLQDVYQELILDCVAENIVMHYAEELVKASFKRFASQAAVDLVARLSNPLGWMRVALDASNEIAPFFVSYSSRNNNFAAYNLHWNGNQLVNVTHASGRPRPFKSNLEKPVANFEVKEGVGLSVTFDASESYVRGEESVTYTWIIDDGQPLYGDVIDVDFDEPGVKHVWLSVVASDTAGVLRDDLRKSIPVGIGSAPVIESLSCVVDPSNRSMIHVSSKVTDIDHDIDQLSWYLSASDQTPYATTAANIQNATLIYPQDRFGSFMPMLVVQDQMGNTTSKLCTVTAAEKKPEENHQGLIAGRYIPIGDGSIIRDLTTGLDWKRCSVGQTWNGTSCSGEPAALTWSEALELIEENGFRVPTQSELNRLVYCTGYGFTRGYPCNMRTSLYDPPTINRQAFPGVVSGTYWGHRYHSSLFDYIYVTNFRTGDGFQKFASSQNKYHLLLVRGKCESFCYFY